MFGKFMVDGDGYGDNYLCGSGIYDEDYGTGHSGNRRKQVGDGLGCGDGGTTGNGFGDSDDGDGDGDGLGSGVDNPCEA